jgi:hypothetical protein
VTSYKFKNGEPEIVGNIQEYKDASGKIVATDYELVAKKDYAVVVFDFFSEKHLRDYCEKHGFDIINGDR